MSGLTHFLLLLRKIKKFFIIGEDREGIRGMDFSSIARGVFSGATQAVTDTAAMASTKALDLKNNVEKVFGAVIKELQGMTPTKADMAVKKAETLGGSTKVDTQTLPEDAAVLYQTSQAYTDGSLPKLVHQAGVSSQQPESQRVTGEAKAEQNKLKETVAELVRSKVLFPLSGKKDPEAQSRLESAALFFNDPQAYSENIAAKRGTSITPEWQQNIGDRKKHMDGQVRDNAHRVAKAAGQQNVTREGLTPKAEVVKIDVPGASRSLSALHLTHGDGSGPTVVVFHANAMTADKMREQAQFYFEQGYNVLVPTMGGYPGSEGVSTCVESIKQDVSAINQHLESKGVQQFGYHGLSMGGALALEAATSNQSKTFFVCTDQTFDTPAGVFSNYLKNHHAPGPICSFAKSVANIATHGGLDNTANAAKIREAKIPFVSVTVQDDAMMAAKGKDQEGRTQGNIGALSDTRVHMSSENWGEYEGEVPEHTSSFVQCDVATRAIQKAMNKGLEETQAKPQIPTSAPAASTSNVEPRGMASGSGMDGVTPGRKSVDLSK